MGSNTRGDRWPRKLDGDIINKESPNIGNDTTQDVQEHMQLIDLSIEEWLDGKHGPSNIPALTYLRPDNYSCLHSKKCDRDKYNR